MNLTRMAAAGLLAIMAGCAAPEKPEYVREGVQYGVTEGVFRGRWWSYYERGNSFLAGGFHEEAASDFQAALQGRDRDSWRARTYGLHFTTYFPNRELGIAYFYLGRLDEARTYLERSLAQVDTECARHYLDQITREQINQGIIVDEAPPRLEGSVAAGTLLADRLVPLEIATGDDVGVARVTVDGRPMYQRGSADALVFTDEMLVAEGVHEVELAAVDLADKETVRTIAFTVDLTGPALGILRPDNALITEADHITIEGVAADANGVADVSLGGQVIAEGAGAERVPFEARAPLAPGANTFVVTARDTAGNGTHTAVEVYRGAPTASARLWQTARRNPAALRQANASAAPLLVTLSATEEPATGIHLKSPEPGRPYRHNRTLRVAGDVVAPGGVAALSINGEPLAPLSGAPRESFNRRIPIDPDAGGEETVRVPVSILAQSQSGETLEQAFEVEVRPVLMDSRESKMPVAVLAFAGNEVEPGDAELLRVATEGALVNQGRFRMVDRANLQEVLTEQQLSAALGNPAEAITLGRLTPAHVFLVADVFRRGGQGLEIKARVISTETSDLVATLDSFVDDRGDRAKVEQGCAAIAEQLRALFPRLSGEVLAVRGSAPKAQLLLNWTPEDGVHEGAYLIVVEEDEPWIDEDTGEVLAPGEYVPVGRAKISGVRSSGATAETAESSAEDVQLEKGMPAVTM